MAYARDAETMTVQWGKGERHATLEVERHVNEHVERWVYHVGNGETVTHAMAAVLLGVSHVIVSKWRQTGWGEGTKWGGFNAGAINEDGWSVSRDLIPFELVAEKRRELIQKQKRRASSRR